MTVKEIERGTFLPVAHQKLQSEMLAAGMASSLQCALGNGETNLQRNLGGFCQQKVLEAEFTRVQRRVLYKCVKPQMKSLI